MRLSTIKLSGFKSFVDPTVLPLPAQMTAIVGPNGCGKSNIIDAVRWVMGESSASRLRGDSLTDVIFSGSNARKPVGTATVELIFDNSDGTISGEYATFNEISVKRSVSRDGQSIYYLNGTRCRRRDITDLFLGTGLGPRSYSIIEQGMISQVIEAKPEELRLFLEEAAGISKYKERRRETENRIRHTRDNLERLGDLREEIGKQINHLARQAKQAEQYKKLGDDLRRLKAETAALAYRELQVELQGVNQQLSGAENATEAQKAALRSAETALLEKRKHLEQTQEAFSTTQGKHYQVAGEIAKLEQTIAHQKQLRTQLDASLSDIQAGLARLQSEQSSDSDVLKTLASQIVRDDEALRTQQETLNGKRTAFEEADAAWQAHQQALSTERQAHAEASSKAQVERTRIEQLERRMLDSKKRQDQLNEQQTSLTTWITEAQSASHQAALTEAQQLVASKQEALSASQQSLNQARTRLSEHQKHLNQLRQTLQESKGRLSSLKTLQQSALGDDRKEVKNWLQANGLTDALRLGQTLTVQSGYESAVEAVLGDLVEAIMVDDSSAHHDVLASQTSIRLTVFDQQADDTQHTSPNLAAFVQGPKAIRQWLSRTAVAENADQAEALLADEGFDRVVTLNGMMIGRGWVRSQPPQSAQTGTLQREREIDALTDQVDQLTTDVTQAEDARLSHAQTIESVEQALEQQRQELGQAQRQHARIEADQAAEQKALDQAQTRHQHMTAELTQLVTMLSEADTELKQGSRTLEQALEDMGNHQQQIDQLQAKHDALHQTRETAHQALAVARDTHQQLSVSLEAAKARQTSLKTQEERLNRQFEELSQRQLDTQKQQKTLEESQDDEPAKLNAALAQRVTLTDELNKHRDAVNQAQQALQTLEQSRTKADQAAQTHQAAVGEWRLKSQALTMRSQTHVEAIEQAGLVVEEVLNALEASAERSSHEQAIEQTEARMRRLEPVNLAAMQEHEQHVERKTYLDSQNDDLIQALETLEKAIHKIDKETRGRFKETYDLVDHSFQEIFPKLFGGGRARLELTGDDLLSTGVSILSQPPGKRVSNISLLSGGEKAMTAVALVMAIFQLNPAPFCMLDEVDAPLDEANVGRFSRLIQEMSKTVQFLVVTHNKTTMEHADALAGVTMRELGVSRLVSVDIDEASQLAAQ